MAFGRIDESDFPSFYSEACCNSRTVQLNVFNGKDTSNAERDEPYVSFTERDRERRSRFDLPNQPR